MGKRSSCLRDTAALPAKQFTSFSPSFTNLEYDLAHETIKDEYLRGLQMGNMVADYLESIGISSDDKDPWLLPVWFHYDLSLAIQLAWWEKTGLTALLPEELPRSIDVLDRIFADAQCPLTLVQNKPNQQLGFRMHSLHRRYLAKCQPRNLRTAFHLDSPEPDELIEALAQFLVATRHSG